MPLTPPKASLFVRGKQRQGRSTTSSLSMLYICPSLVLEHGSTPKSNQLSAGLIYIRLTPNVAVRTSGFVFGLLAMFLFGIPFGMVWHHYWWPNRHKYFPFKSRKPTGPDLPTIELAPRPPGSPLPPSSRSDIGMAFVRRPQSPREAIRLADPPKRRCKIDVSPSVQSLQAEIQEPAPARTRDRAQRTPNPKRSNSRPRAAADPRLKRTRADRNLQEVYYDDKQRAELRQDFRDIPQ